MALSLDFGLPTLVALVLVGLAVVCAVRSHLAWRKAIANQHPGRDARAASAEERRRNLAGFFTDEGREHIKTSSTYAKLAIGGFAAVMLLAAVSMVLA